MNTKLQKWAGMALFTGFLAAPALSPAMNFRVDGEKIWLSATNEPLINVLKAFSESSVNVKYDPAIQHRISGSYQNREIDEVLEKVLNSVDYVLIWKLIKGPVGPIIRLDELQVFNKGQANKAKPLVTGGGNYKWVLSADGTFMFVPDELLLGLKKGMTKKEFLKLLASINGTVVESIPERGIYRIKLPPGTAVEELVKKLQENEKVHVAEPNYVFKAPTGLQDIGGVQSLPIRGADIPPGMSPVAILDSGIMPMAGLQDAVVGKFDATDPSRKVNDTIGHGTQMALIASGAVLPYGTPGDAGLANVPVLAIRVFDDNGLTSNFDMMNSLVYAQKSNAELLTMSWGSNVDSQFLSDTVSSASANGMILIASAGNEPTGRPMYPAAYPSVISVSATDRDGQIWKNSNYGPTITLSAPGLASFPVGHNGPPGTYKGTSLGPPLIANKIAELKRTHPHITKDQILQRLKDSLTDKGPKGYDNRYGHGVFDRDAINRFLGK